MVALADATLRKHLKNGMIRIIPFDESNLTPAGYDLRSAQDIVLKPREQKLLATLERVELTSNILGLLHIRSSFAREGIFASLAIVDPGFRGQLTVSLLNAGEDELKIQQGESFLQLTLIQLSSNAERTYEGKYQDSLGIVESKREPNVIKSSKEA